MDNTQFKQERKLEIAAAIERADTHAADLMLAALALSEMIESGIIENKPREDGGRPLKIFRAPLEDVSEYVTELQARAKTAADELMFIKSEVSDYLKQE